MIYKRDSINVNKSDKYVYFVVIDNTVTGIFINEIDALNYIEDIVYNDLCYFIYQIKRINLEAIYND